MIEWLRIHYGNLAFGYGVFVVVLWLVLIYLASDSHGEPL